MDKDGSHMTERLLSLTLEIIYLLTGEDYRPMKRESTDRVTYHKDLNKIQKPLTAPRPERSSQQKILELTNKILELLTGEVPIRCQDVAVYFTMEEWEYIEGHKDLYKDAMMDDHQTLTSADGTGTRRTPKRCPSPPYPLCKEEYDETLPYEDIEMKEVVVGSEFGDDDDEMCTMGDSQCKEEEAPLCIHPDASPSVSDFDRHYAMYTNFNMADTMPYPRDDYPVLFRLGPLSPSAHAPADGSVRGHVKVSPNFSQSNSGPKTGKKLFTCEECGKSLTRKENLISHQRIHTGEKPFSCPQCGKCFKKTSHLSKHQQIHTGEKPFSCHECGKSFAWKGDLVVHERIHSGEKPYACAECGKCFSIKSYLVKHQRIHTGEKPYACAECGKCFSSSSNVLLHRKIHAGQKPHVCSECGKCFVWKSDLVNHQRIHTGEKPYECPECQKSFSSISYFVKHQRIHTGEKPYPCTECGKSFYSRSNLVLHQKIHTGEKPFSCSECNRSFAWKTDFVKHQRFHTGEKPFECPECGKRFMTKPDLNDHKKIHTGEKPFSCAECGKGFVQKARLVKHQLTHTNLDTVA